MNPAIHAAAAAKQRRERQEEEEMTGYNGPDLDGWEFKIVRSALGRFGNSEIVKRLMAEEAQNGWEMLEKFDDYRIRFKRRTEKRALHSGGAIDPYRTNFGVSHWVGPIVGLVVALIVAGVLLFSKSAGKSNEQVVAFFIIGLITAVAAALFVIRRVKRS
jgi:hypothetical protein